jgi:hypothetical protein
VARIELQECADESAALLRESQLLREVRPKYNRAGTWPPPPRFFAWRSLEQEIQLAIAEAPRADWQTHGPLGRAAGLLREALARLLWLAVHPHLGFTRLPNGWSHGRLAKEPSVDCGPMITGVASKLEELMSGQLAGFSAWIRAQRTADTHPFEKAALEADLETLSDALHPGPLGHGVKQSK